jgi:hypothetical protein
MKLETDLDTEHTKQGPAPMKHLWSVLALGGCTLAALALGTARDPDAVRLVTVWTARLTLPLFVVAFVSLGQRAATGTQGIACRTAAFAMALHLLALIRLSLLMDRVPLVFQTVGGSLVSLGGLAAASLVLVGWICWDRSWYRWAVYWPWAVFLFTYLFLARQGEQASRVVAAPLSFLPVVGLLLLALGWRVSLDIKAVKTTVL